MTHIGCDIDLFLQHIEIIYGRTRSMFCVLMDCDQNMEQGIGHPVDQVDGDHNRLAVVHV